MNKPVKLFLFFIIASVLSFHPGISQSLTGTIEGKVFDSKTKETLQGVEIVIVGTRLKALSDEYGHFNIPDISVGDHSIEFSLPGYKKVIQNFQMFPEKTIFLDVALEEAMPRISEHITVFGKARYPGSQNAAKAVKFNSDEASKMPSSVEDISRVLKITPGISHVNELCNELIVRGGSPWENGFYIDNIHVPNINHYQNHGGTGGTTGMINVLFIENVDFYTGGFSVAYGDRMSSITEIRFREGNKDDIKTRINLNTTGFGGYMEGPGLGGKATWMLSLKRSYYDVVAKIIGYGVAPRFGDINLKMTFDFNQKNKITLLNIYGDSRFSVDLEAAIEEGHNSFINYNTNQNTTGINWLSIWNEKGYSEISLSYSFFNSSNTISHVSTGSEWMAIDTFDEEINLRNINIFQMNDTNRVEFGFNVKHEKSDLNNYFAEYLSSLGITVPEFSLQGDIKTVKGGLFIAYIYDPLKYLRTSVGIRSDYFSYNKRFNLSPRFTTTLSINEKLAVEGSFGMYHQTLPLYLLYGNTESRNNKNPISTQFSLSLNYDLAEHTQFRISLYNKSYRNLPLRSNDPSFLVMDRVVNFNIFRSNEILYDSGKAFSRGFELLLKKNVARDFYGIISLSLFRSRFKNYDGNWTNRVNDNQYLLTVIGGYNTSSNWRFSVRCNLAGGVPYTPSNVERSREHNSWIIDQARINANRYPPYFSLNVRIDHQFKVKESIVKFYLGAINVLNRKNVLNYYWNKIDNELGTVYQSPILPMFGIEYSF